MKAAAAARAWWAAFRRRTPESRAASALRAAASHLSSYVLMALAVAMLACAVAGFAVTVREDQRLAAERHAALELALDEVRGVFGASDGFDDSRLPLVARLAGLKDLRFDTDEDSASGREAQSLHDENGRIVGWFSWAADRTLIRAEIWLWGLIGAVGAALGVCAFLAAGLIQRLARLLASSLKTIRKLTREDALTGLPNHRVMLESLDRALARRQFRRRRAGSHRYRGLSRGQRHPRPLRRRCAVEKHCRTSARQPAGRRPVRPLRRRRIRRHHGQRRYADRKRAR